jgi:phosphate-selective porin OprO/OprP
MSRLKEWKGLGRWAAGSCTGLILIAGLALGQEGGTGPVSEIDLLKKQIQILREEIDSLKQNKADVKPAVLPEVGADGVTPAAAPGAPAAGGGRGGGAAPKEPEWSEVGKDLKMNAVWNHGLWVETADKAFRIHVGGRVQLDAIWNHAEDEVAFGAGGVGKVDDALAFRRARLEVDGTFWEVVDFFTEFDFVNTTDVDPTDPAKRSDVTNIPVPTDLWAQVTHLPYVNTVRVGNQKPPISMEHLTSSRFLPFLERSFAFDAFIGGLDNGFKPGVQLINWSEDERITWAIGAFKNQQTVLGWNVGDGEYDVTGRVTMLPVYEHDGLCMVHLGIAASHRDVDEDRYRLRARSLLRNGPAALHTALSNQVIGANSQTIIVPEFAAQWGPLSIQAEYYANWFEDTIVDPNGAAANQGTTYQQSAYVQVMYFLTPGDMFTYTKKLGSGPAFARVVPVNPFYYVAGDCGNLLSCGAWQVAARYSWIDLDDKGLHGGVLQDFTLGLNWYLNPNLKYQWNYSAGHRNAAGDTSDGWIHGFGVRMAYDF